MLLSPSPEDIKSDQSVFYTLIGRLVVHIYIHLT